MGEQTDDFEGRFAEEWEDDLRAKRIARAKDSPLLSQWARMLESMGPPEPSSTKPPWMRPYFVGTRLVTTADAIDMEFAALWRDRLEQIRQQFGIPKEED